MKALRQLLLADPKARQLLSRLPGYRGKPLPRASALARELGWSVDDVKAMIRKAKKAGADIGYRGFGLFWSVPIYCGDIRQILEAEDDAPLERKKPEGG